MSSVDLTIDPMRLEEEWKRHPALYKDIADSAVEAQEIFDIAKSKLDLVEAELDDDIRQNPDEYDLVKVTETSVKSKILQDPKYKAAQSALIDARKNLGLAKAAVDAFEHKKRALTLLVELYIHDYYSEKTGNSPVSLTDEEKRAVRNRGRTRRESNESASD